MRVLLCCMLLAFISSTAAENFLDSFINSVKDATSTAIDDAIEKGMTKATDSVFNFPNKSMDVLNSSSEAADKDEE
ncbi:hypothetical protein CCR75_006338 [Bremia lactucae]|uniref:Uncharacterized protein n=1 Tax=Bremia lactucae TaxID=4779 RepID=A0A976IGC0_BRELC|nr:hypothetical protein CCR75_006338 [Bremia lactucae]